MVKLNTSLYLPNAFISTSTGSTKNRLKIYGTNNIFLEKDSEFQIEFVNFTDKVYLAMIKMNGKLISNSGLILKPGTHFYLDRYLDISKRFKFDVYEVEDTPEVNKAISNNGDIEILFYKEKEIPNNISFITSYTTDHSNSIYGPLYYKGSHYFDQQRSINYCQTLSSNQMMTTNSVKSKKETGRVEQGSSSNQSFSYENREFEDQHTYSVYYKLLPISQVNSTNIREYCTYCGYRLRDNKWIFCPKCGNRV
jgi:hypothetical protein